MRQTKNGVCVAWVWTTSKEGIALLSACESVARVFERDRYDPRLGSGLPYFDHIIAACAWMNAHPRRPCQIALGAAKILVRSAAPGVAFAALREATCAASG